MLGTQKNKKYRSVADKSLNNRVKSRSNAKNRIK